MATSLTTRQRFQRMYAHQEADRIPVWDSPWQETIARWVSEGMPTPDYVEAFHLDKIASIGADNSPRLPEQTLSETEDSIVRTTAWGATVRTFKHRTTTPEHIGFQVTSPDTWRAVRERMTPSDDRIPWDTLRRHYKTWRAQGRWITGMLWFGFDITHTGMVGTETLLMAMIDDPEWCMDMFNHELDVSMALLQRAWDAGYTFDEVHWYDDMGYKGTQFFSLPMYRQILKPVHQRAADWAHSLGCRVRVHSCGNINPFVPELIDIGVDALNPLEVKAGMDPVALKARYGSQLVLHGGVNAVLWDQPDVICEQIERIVPVMKQNGGYIFASDHSIPPHVSLRDFERIISTVLRAGSYA